MHPAIPDATLDKCLEALGPSHALASKLNSHIKAMYDSVMSQLERSDRLYVDGLDNEQIYPQLEGAIDSLDLPELLRIEFSESGTEGAERSDDGAQSGPDRGRGDDEESSYLERGGAPAPSDDGPDAAEGGESGEETGMDEADDEASEGTGEEEEVGEWGTEVDDAKARRLEAEFRNREDEEAALSDEESLGLDSPLRGELDALASRDAGRRAAHAHAQQDAGNLTEYERARLKLQGTIARIEDEMLADKEWFMRGEVNASHRQRDALLAKVDEMDFDVKRRAAVRLTEELNTDIDDVIRLRVKDKRFDDPVYRAAAADGPADPAGGDAVISDAKSKATLAEDIAGIARRERIGERKAVSAEVQALQNECLELFARLDGELTSYTSIYATQK